MGTDLSDMYIIKKKNEHRKINGNINNNNHEPHGEHNEFKNTTTNRATARSQSK